jgi:hypothetical protein
MKKTIEADNQIILAPNNRHGAKTILSSDLLLK